MARYTHQDQYTVIGINNEFEKIEQAFKDMLSRVGDSGNALEADVDANGSRILNLPEPLSNSEPLTLGKGQAILDDATAEANRAEQEADRAATESDQAIAAANAAATQSGQFATESENSAIDANNAATQLNAVLDDAVASGMSFPLDLGSITESLVANQFDLGSIV